MGLEDRGTLLVSPGYQPLVMCSRPGYPLRSRSGRETCRAFAAEARQQRIRPVVVLMTRVEIELLYGFDLCAFYESQGLEPVHFPIEDGSVPDDRPRFHALIKGIRDRLRKEGVVVHCNAGLGRTGVVAGGLLVLGGARWDSAIRRVREAREGAVQNRWQEQFLRDYEKAVIGATLGAGGDE